MHINYSCIYPSYPQFIKDVYEKGISLSLCSCMYEKGECSLAVLQYRQVLLMHSLLALKHFCL